MQLRRLVPRAPSTGEPAKMADIEDLRTAHQRARARIGLQAWFWLSAEERVAEIEREFRAMACVRSSIHAAPSRRMPTIHNRK